MQSLVIYFISYNLRDAFGHKCSIQRRFLPCEYNNSRIFFYGQNLVHVNEKMLKHHAMNTYGEVDLQLHAFLICALDGVEWSLSRTGRFNPRETARVAR